MCTAVSRISRNGDRWDCEACPASGMTWEESEKHSHPPTSGECSRDHARGTVRCEPCGITMSVRDLWESHYLLHEEVQ